MKKITLISSLILLMISVKPTFAGEVTDLETDFLGYLNITFYDSNANYMDRISCTAFNLSNKAIGGGSSLIDGGIAVVSFRVPKKYLEARLTAKCKNESSQESK